MSNQTRPPSSPLLCENVQFRKVEATPKSTSHLSPVSCFCRLRLTDLTVISVLLALLHAPRVRDQIPRVGIQVVENVFFKQCFGHSGNFPPLQIPSPFICKSNVVLTTSTCGGIMRRNIEWIGVSKSSEKRFRSHTVCETIRVQRALKKSN